MRASPWAAAPGTCSALRSRAALGEQVGAGLGQTTSTGEATILTPSLDVTTTGEKHTIDGVEFEFQMAPGTEAPSEMHFYIPRYRALCMAENATHTLHNLLTLRGAVVRDPHVWSQYLTEAIERFGGEAEVVFASHHWPTWGNADDQPVPRASSAICTATCTIRRCDC